MKKLSLFAKHRKRVFPVLLALLTVLSWGCQTKPDARDAAGAETDTATVEQLPLAVPKAEMLDESPLQVDRIIPKRVEDAQDESMLPARATGEDTAAAESKYPETLVKGIKDPDATVKVMLNLDAAPLTEVVPLFAELLNFSYLIDPGVKGAVTMTIDSDMTAREVWKTFEHVLWLSGAYASRNPGFIHVLPFQKMPQERRLLADHDPQANVAVTVMPIKYGKSAEILALLQPFATPGATLTNLPRLNAILAVEAPANLSKLKKLVDILDVKGEAPWPRIAIRCHEDDAAVLQEELQTLMPVLGLPVSAQTPSGGATKINAVPRLQLIVASSPVKEVLDKIKYWIHLLDRQDAAEQENIYFYNVRHSTADHLAEALSVFFSETSSTTRQPRRTESRAVSSRARAPDSPEARPQTTGSRRRPSPNDTSPNHNRNIFETPLLIFADGDQNRLTIRTTQRAYAMVEALLKRLDVPPRQVLIQAVVADITLNESTEYGFSYAAMQKYNDYVIKHAMINASGTESTNFPEPKTFTDGVAFLLRKDEDKMAFLRAVAGESNVRVLSAPQIMATSDQEAIINVGDRVPIITGDYTDVSGSTSTTTGTIHRNIEYTDTGVILTVTPHITAGNEVRLEIVQEVSDAVKTESSGIDSPTIRNRELSTTLVVPDQGTALLGGLIRTRETDNESGVPILMKTPVLGALFRSNSKENRRTELLVMITVNVVENTTPAEALARRYEAALREINEKLQPLDQDRGQIAE